MITIILQCLGYSLKCIVAQSYLTLCDPMECIAHQALLSTDFSRQEYRNKLPFPSPGDLSNPGIEPAFPVCPVLAGVLFTTSASWEAHYKHTHTHTHTHTFVWICRCFLGQTIKRNWLLKLLSVKVGKTSKLCYYRIYRNQNQSRKQKEAMNSYLSSRGPVFQSFCVFVGQGGWTCFIT